MKTDIQISLENKMEEIEKVAKKLKIKKDASEKLFTDCMADIISSFGELNVLRSDIDINPFTEL